VHNASLMHRIDIVATATKAATNMARVPHPLRHQTKMVHTDDGTERCLEEVKIAPPNPTFLELIGHGVMLSHTAPSATTLGAETIPTDSSNHELIDGMDSVLGRVG
jgi:hypothetical protein